MVSCNSWQDVAKILLRYPLRVLIIAQGFQKKVRIPEILDIKKFQETGRKTEKIRTGSKSYNSEISVTLFAYETSIA